MPETHGGRSARRPSGKIWNRRKDAPPPRLSNPRPQVHTAQTYTDVLSFTSSLGAPKSYKTGLPGPSWPPTTFAAAGHGQFLADDAPTVAFSDDVATVDLRKAAPRLAKDVDHRSEFQLTHWQVPQNSDYARPYCTACHFTDCERCSYCVSNKLTKARRMNMERLGGVVLQLQPNIDARDLLHVLCRYARSDTFADELNVRLGWCPPASMFCGEHQAALDHLDGLEAEHREKLQRKIEELQHEQKLRVRAEADARQARKALDLETLDEADLKLKLQKLTIKHHELEHDLKDRAEDIEHMKKHVSAAMKHSSHAATPRRGSPRLVF